MAIASKILSSLDVSADGHPRGRRVFFLLSHVWLVRDTETGELRALKRLQVPDGAAAGLMKNEYGALARVRHENVVGVHEYGTLAGGEAYFTMDFIDGARHRRAVRRFNTEVVIRRRRRLGKRPVSAGLNGAWQERPGG